MTDGPARPFRLVLPLTWRADAEAWATEFLGEWVSARDLAARHERYGTWIYRLDDDNRQVIEFVPYAKASGTR